ncbi:MAG: porin [Gammaproteobacteria bacterium]|nr:porin [Gammaproteobacteria bacterium]|tara:strand:+ start:124 stop:1050 length:927 start_codon:yes stop_codon:yes gene_type:complete
MNRKLVIFIALSFFGLSLNAQPEVYGKLWISIESQDTSSGSEVDMVSNASRLGVKGSMDFGEGLEAIYQAEYEVDPVDGTADEKNGRTFKQRNSFVGIKGSYGTLFLGTHDTALKKSQSKIDLFNDLAGDIKNILQGENRMSDFIGYTTPTLGDGFSATFNAIKDTEEEDSSIGDSTSISLNYKTKSFYAAIAFDSEVKGYDTTRISFQVPLNKTQIGIIYQDTEELNSGLEEDGYVLSLSQKIREKGVFKVQLAESDMKIGSGKQTSIGYDYQLSKKAKAFVFYTDLSGDNLSKEKEITAVGFEYKF